MHETHPADTDGDFRISLADLLSCASDWITGKNGVLSGVPQEHRKFYILRAAMIVAAKPDGAYYDDEVTPQPHNWQPVP